ncbi:hypothetical protein D9758_016290 [Tetrapyrgos nigripes]|uniref:O-methyltransferase C-terminal domain-containing protein n=1 Tax=Tetrapyrgos nigripes TaxID=182062 RepID=A0A8H5FIG6_9AGAR|nr:hypothetical protein D9758_016290 [Tetrapyrgos nigripes]
MGSIKPPSPFVSNSIQIPTFLETFTFMDKPPAPFSIPRIQTGTREIDALLNLIITSTMDALTEYKKTGAGIPTPYATEAHPLDNVPDALDLKRAIRTLEGACEALCTTLAQPMHTIINRSMPFEAQCMRLVIGNHIADILEQFPSGLHVAEIASKTKNRMNPRKLGQVMGLLAARGCFREGDIRELVRQQSSLLVLRSTDPVSAYAHLSTYESGKAITIFPETMAIPEYVDSETTDKCAFTYAVQDEEVTGFYEWFRKHPDLGVASAFQRQIRGLFTEPSMQMFDQSMIGITRVEGSLSIVNNYPWSELAQGTTFCDVGSGFGTIPLALVKAHPHLKIILQDLPNSLEQAKKMWNSEYPQAIQSGVVRFEPLDFIAEAPVKDQDIYYMKHIVHNYPDARAIKILKNVAAAMKPSSVLFIHEYVMASQDAHENPLAAKAPEPLLSNYGSGNLRKYNQDLHMLILFNARQRTYEQFRGLGESAGLELIELVDLVEMLVLKFRKMQDAKADFSDGLGMIPALRAS